MRNLYGRSPDRLVLAVHLASDVQLGENVKKTVDATAPAAVEHAYPGGSDRLFGRAFPQHHSLGQIASCEVKLQHFGVVVQ